jgi:hypothetical protein
MIIVLHQIHCFMRLFSFFQMGSMLKLWPVVVAILDFSSTQKHTFCKGSFEEYSSKDCCEMVYFFQIRIILSTSP